MRKRPDLTEATKQRFVDAFCEIYQTKPVEKITVREIAERAGHNRVTFYQYFRDPYDVLESLENKMIANVKEAIRQNIARPDMFADFDKMVEQLVARNSELAFILLTGANYLSTLERYKGVMLPTVMEIFAVAEDDYRARAVIEFYISGVVSLLKYAVDHRDDINMAEIGDIIRPVLQNGILPQLRGAE